MTIIPNPGDDPYGNESVEITKYLENYEYSATVEKLAHPESSPLRENWRYGFRIVGGQKTYFIAPPGGDWVEIKEDSPEAKAFDHLVFGNGKPVLDNFGGYE